MLPELLSAHELQEAVGLPVTENAGREARSDLRRQIARMELELGELFGSAFPRAGGREIQFGVPAPGGPPRILSVDELERVRDSLAARLQDVRCELGALGRAEQRNRERLEMLVAEPERHRWIRISNEDIGEPGCRHWHSRPRWGLLGVLLNWWRVKVSSGCPLAGGRGPAASTPPSAW